MQLNSASDYKFITGENRDSNHPHGDIDRILIDGIVDPDSPILLRGQDITVIAESLLERLHAISNSDPVDPTDDSQPWRTYHVFTRKLSLKQIRDIIKLIDEFFVSSPLQDYPPANVSPWMLQRQFAILNPIAVQTFKHPYFIETMESGSFSSFVTREQLNEYQELDEEDYSGFVPISKNTIKKLFQDISMMKAFLFKFDIGMFSFDATTDFDIVTAGHGYQYLPTGAYIFTHYVIYSGGEYSWLEDKSEYTASLKQNPVTKFRIQNKYLFGTQQTPIVCFEVSSNEVVNGSVSTITSFVYDSPGTIIDLSDRDDIKLYLDFSTISQRISRYLIKSGVTLMHLPSSWQQNLNHSQTVSIRIAAIWSSMEIRHRTFT